MRTFLTLLFCSLFSFTAVWAQTTDTPPDLLKNKISIRPAVSVVANEGKSMNLICTCGPSAPEDQPIVLVDGNRSTLEGVRSLDAAKIMEMNVSHDKKWIQVYGDLARNGVIYVTLKKPANTLITAQ